MCRVPLDSRDCVCTSRGTTAFRASLPIVNRGSRLAWQPARPPVPLGAGPISPCSIYSADNPDGFLPPHCPFAEFSWLSPLRMPARAPRPSSFPAGTAGEPATCPRPRPSALLRNGLPDCRPYRPSHLWRCLPPARGVTRPTGPRTSRHGLRKSRQPWQRLPALLGCRCRGYTPRGGWTERRCRRPEAAARGGLPRR